MEYAIRHSLNFRQEAESLDLNGRAHRATFAGSFATKVGDCGEWQELRGSVLVESPTPRCRPMFEAVEIKRGFDPSERGSISTTSWNGSTGWTANK